MNQINCVSEDFWEKPFNIDFDDKKFGYCVLAVFNKKKEFQRTYMIPASIRNKVLHSKRQVISNYTLDDISDKVYNMCQEASPSFDSYKSVMHYYNKTEKMWKNRKVYAVYVNFLSYYKGYNINYQEQIIGESDDLSNDELDQILTDVRVRYKICDLQKYNISIGNRSYVDRSSIERVRPQLQNFFFFTNADNTPNYTKKRNFQMMYASCGINIPDYELPVLDLLQATRTYVGNKCGGTKPSEDCKGYATSLIINDLILGAKCIYQSVLNNICRGYWSFSEAIKAMCVEYFCGKKMRIQFKNELYLINTLRASLKCFAICEARSKYYGSTSRCAGDFYDVSFRYDLSCMYDHGAAMLINGNNRITLNQAKDYVSWYTSQDKYNMCFQVIPYLFPVNDISYFYRGVFAGCRMPAYDEAYIYNIKFTRDENDRFKIHEIIT